VAGLAVSLVDSFGIARQSDKSFVGSRAYFVFLTLLALQGFHLIEQ
jgi:hypothetical protein